MSIGTLSFHRFNGSEQFSIAQAKLFLLKGYEDDSPHLSFDFEAASTPLTTLPDTEPLHALPSGEFNVDVPTLDVSNLVGQVFSIPEGNSAGDWLARIYYVEHDAARNCTLRVLEWNGDQFRVSVDGYCTDLNFYDGSKPDTHFVLEAWFALHY
jgi:hypothetical protein